MSAAEVMPLSRPGIPGSVIPRIGHPDVPRPVQCGCMGIVPDHQIREEWISPFDPGLVESASYDLTLAGEALVPVPLDEYERDYNRWRDAEIERYDSEIWMRVRFNDEFVLRHLEFALFSTIEVVTLPASVAGYVSGKSRVARRGRQIEAAGFVDPGFTGQLTLEVVNFNPYSQTFTVGQRIGQIVFHRLDGLAAFPYSPERGNHYQGQRGPQL